MTITAIARTVRTNLRPVPVSTPTLSAPQEALGYRQVASTTACATVATAVTSTAESRSFGRLTTRCRRKSAIIFHPVKIHATANCDQLCFLFL